MRRPSWGDTVQVKAAASPELRPGQLAAVCGMREVDTADQAIQVGRPIGTTVYLVEFGDGHAVELPEDCVDVVSG